MVKQKYKHYGSGADNIGCSINFRGIYLAGICRLEEKKKINAFPFSESIFISRSEWNNFAGFVFGNT
jgi:hypothetical protein